MINGIFIHAGSLKNWNSFFLNFCYNGLVYKSGGGHVLRRRRPRAVSGANCRLWSRGAIWRRGLWDCSTGPLAQLRHCFWNVRVGLLHWRHHHVQVSHMPYGLLLFYQNVEKEAI
jgi:hypothetical protein